MTKLLILAVLIGFGALGLPHDVAAQTTLSVDIHKAKLTWQWAVGPAPTEGIPTEFRMKCGAATGVYSKITPVPYPTKEIPVENAIAGIGRWFCAVSAANTFGESGLSNEVSFDAGAIPTKPTNESVVVQ